MADSKGATDSTHLPPSYPAYPGGPPAPYMVPQTTGAPLQGGLPPQEVNYYAQQPQAPQLYSPQAGAYAQDSLRSHTQPQPIIIAPTAAQIGDHYRAEMYAQCARGQHQRKVTYGVCGIIIAIILFPIGLLAMLADRREECTRCHQQL